MKKSLKKAIALLLAMVSILSTAAFPASATSVTGTLGGSIGCSGSNSISKYTATATTTAGSPVTLRVTLHYQCKNSITSEYTKERQITDSNSPRTSITVLLDCVSPTYYPSGVCWSDHDAYGNGASWHETTAHNYFRD